MAKPIIESAGQSWYITTRSHKEVTCPMGHKHEPDYCGDVTLSAPIVKAGFDPAHDCALDETALMMFAQAIHRP